MTEIFYALDFLNQNFLAKFLHIKEQLLIGKPILLKDNEHRENEADIILPAAFANKNNMTIMIKNGSGIISLACDESFADKFSLPNMIDGKNSLVSIDRSFGIKSGISSHDRALTCAHFASNSAKKDDFISPGHIFPIKAEKEGIFTRQGHTEGAVELMHLCGIKKAAIMTELLNDDGDIPNEYEIKIISQKHNWPLFHVDDVYFLKLFTTEIKPQIVNDAQKFIFQDKSIIDFIMPNNNEILSIEIKSSNYLAAEQKNLPKNITVYTNDIENKKIKLNLFAKIARILAFNGVKKIKQNKKSALSNEFESFMLDRCNIEFI